MNTVCCELLRSFTIAAKISSVMGSRLLRQRPLLTLPQLLVLLAVIAALFIALDLNRRAQAGRLVGVGEEE
jgi:hypothetical protein